VVHTLEANGQFWLNFNQKSNLTLKDNKKKTSPRTTFYPTRSTRKEALEEAKAALPITDPNQLQALLETYVNSTLKENTE